MKSNRQYKDSVFSFLFSNPETLRELYGAIKGIELPHDVPITINTLEDVLYKTILNDISFEVDNKLVILIEHQSTINPNMALRLLMYIARIYEKITAGKNLYGRKRMSLPRPEFIVLYNGVDPYPDETTLKLSDSFEDTSSLGITKDTFDLELTVKIYNLNRGHNKPIIRRCEKLDGYSAFVAKVRECEAEIGRSRKPHLTKDDKKEAMKNAIEWCIIHNILKPFLEANGSEVLNMLMTQWKLKDALVVEREEGHEEGAEEKQWENVRNLLEYGMTPEQISQALKLPLETVRKCQNYAKWCASP
jgi:predicted transposase YdaD